MLKATVSVVMSVRPSVCTEQLGSHWTDFHEIWHLSIFRKCVLKIHVSLKPDKNIGHYKWKQYTFLVTSRSIILIIKMFQTNILEKVKTHILYSITFFFFLNRAVYEIMWKNIVELGRPQTTIQRMRIACWITKVTNTHSEYVIFISFPLQQWSQERTSVSLYT